MWKPCCCCNLTDHIRLPIIHIEIYRIYTDARDKNRLDKQIILFSRDHTKPRTELRSCVAQQPNIQVTNSYSHNYLSVHRTDTTIS